MLQNGIEQQRAFYGQLPRPLLAQIAELHQLSVRDLANIFGISKSYAQQILNHQKLPPLDLAIRMARYWEVSVEDLFGWRVDDDGYRRPLLVEVPGTGKLVTLSSKNRTHRTMGLVAALVERLKEKR